MPAVRRKRFMSGVRCFVRTEKHSLNRDLARRSSKPSTKVLSFQFYCAHKAPTGILVYPSMIRSSQTSSSCHTRLFWVVKGRPVNILSTVTTTATRELLQRWNKILIHRLHAHAALHLQKHIQQKML